MQRLQNLKSQIKPNSCAITDKRDDDVVIVAAFRTPLTKAKRGGLKDTTPDGLLTPVFKALIERSKIDPKKIGDITVGNNLQSGAGEIPHRMAAFMAGIPETTPIVSINRLCSSGLEACAIIASKIKAGIIDIGIGAGVEQMSLFDMNASVDPEKLSEAIFDHEKARNCMMGMGQTSENVAEKYGVTRQQQDQLAVESHQKAAKAQQAGLFKDEIVPIQTKIKDKDGNEKQITVTADDGIRGDTTLAGLGKLKPAFKKDGTTTAGNSLQITDGAAAVLLARRSEAVKLGLPIIGKFAFYSVVGVAPEIMGIGPAAAIPDVLKKAGIQTNDVDIYEINEAFASQAKYCCDFLKLDMSRVNPKGGAIALGHPLGCTGARQIATLMPELKRQNKKIGCVSMCIGTGMGAAAIIVSEQ